MDTKEFRKALLQTPDEMKDLANAFCDMLCKTSHHVLRRDYYDGKQPLKFSSAKLQSYFGGSGWQFAEWCQNMCAVVVDSVVDRMSIARFDSPDTQTADLDGLQKVFETSGANREFIDAVQDAMVCGEGFMIGWHKADAVGVEVYRNPPENCCAVYSEDNPNEMTYAAKRWMDGDGYWRVTVYYADRLEYWRSVKPAEKIRGWRPDEWEPCLEEPGAPQGRADNPAGVIPVFHFAVNRDRVSELDRAIPIQDSINKIVSDMMLACDYSSTPMRYIITRAEFPSGTLKVSAGKILTVPPADEGEQATELGSLEATDPGTYLKMLDQAVNAMAIITRTPKHFLYGATGDPSGEALVALEAPMVKKCARYQERLVPTLQALARFIIAAMGGTPTDEIYPVFAPVETIQPRTKAEIWQLKVNAGYPLVAALRDDGYTDSEIDDVLADARKGTMAKPVASPDVQATSLDAATNDTAQRTAPDIGAFVQQLSDQIRLSLAKDSAAMDAIVNAKRVAAAGAV